VAGFLRVLGFPLPIFIPPIAPQSPSSIIRGWYNRPVVAALPGGLSPTLLKIIIILVIINYINYACQPAAVEATVANYRVGMSDNPKSGENSRAGTRSIYIYIYIRYSGT
jgi:hypothetical protein